MLDPTTFQGLARAQDQLHEWRERNFPRADSTQQLLGVVEELGELSHIHLKAIQRIRQGRMSPAEIQRLKEDAIGDIIIYLMGYCSYEGLSLSHCLDEAGAEVLERDWLTNPQYGGSE